MIGFAKLSAKALAHDRAGDLAEVTRLLLPWNPSFVDGGAADLSEAFRFKAKLLRHRVEPLSLAAALDAAESALALARLSDRDAILALASLELISCRITARQLDAIQRDLRPWLSHPDTRVAGWAWVLSGQAHLKNDEPFQAVAALQNALAEFARGADDFRVRTARITLADAMDRCGRIRDASRLLKQDRGFWTGEPEVRRTSVFYFLLAARNRRNDEDIGGALRDVHRARELLQLCTDMPHLQVAADALRASCHVEWGQARDASRDALQSLTAAGELTHGTARRRPRRVPLPPPPVRLAPPGNDLLLQHNDFHADILADVKEAARLTYIKPSNLVETTQLTHSESAETLVRRARSVLGAARQFGVQGDSVVIGAVERLAGVPGLEREEAQALFDAGLLLHRSGNDVEAERMLRRCLARLSQREGMRLLRGRVLVALARTIRSRPAAALPLVVEGLQLLDEERFKMYRRRYRSNWLESEINPAYDIAIELALTEGRLTLAADLIIRSRTSGVTVSDLPDARHLGDSDVPLVPPPRLVYIDGTASELPGEHSCRYC